jgi:EmrB/QacA subfamily drug resistance transporter
VHRPAVLAVLCVTLLVISLDNTILNVALPSIVRSLGATSAQLQWAVDVYALTFAGLLLTMGALGDRLGRKWVFMAGLFVFGAGSAFAAWSGSPSLLITARGVMGLGAAALMPGTLSILTNVFPRQSERARAIGVWSGTAGLGVALGPILGGLLLARYWWGSVFLVNVPIVVAGLFAAAWLVPNSRTPDARRPDPVGALLSMVSLATVVWSVVEAPQRGWSSPTVLIPLVIGVVGAVAFVSWEQHTDHPMLPMRFFGRRRYSVAVGVVCLAMFAMMGMFFLLTQYLQFSLGLTPLAAGLRVAPIAAAVLLVAPAAVLAARRIGTKAVVVAGLALVAAGLGWFATTGLASTYSDALPSFLLLGVGIALTLSPCTASVMSTLPTEEAGVGSATNDTAMQIGGALGVGVLGTALNFRYQGHLLPVLVHAGAQVPAGIERLVLGSLGGALAVAHHLPPRQAHALETAARSAFISGMDLAALVAMGVALAGAVVALIWLPNRPASDPGGRSGRFGPHRLARRARRVEDRRGHR